MLTTRDTHPHPEVRQQVRLWARELFRQPNFYTMDTETTGLGGDDRIVQIGIIDKHGATVLDTLVQPGRAVPPDVTRIHGITDAMLVDAPTIADLYGALSGVLAGADVVAYNMDFDWRMLLQSLNGLPAPRVRAQHCAMKQYARYAGALSRRYGDYRWHKLAVACAQESIRVQDTHSALGDVRLTLALLQTMAGEVA
jgi:DNA polymerase III subunit epsilon